MSKTRSTALIHAITGRAARRLRNLSNLFAKRPARNVLDAWPAHAFEPLEDRVLLSAAVSAPIADFGVTQNSPASVVQLNDSFFDDDIPGTVVRYDVQIGAVNQFFNVALTDDQTPLTVENYLNYVDDDDWDNTFFHRSLPGFVIQAGGFYADPPTVSSVPADAPVPNEFGISNLRGTIAMAKLGGDPNSATNQWFFNLADNSGVGTGPGGGNDPDGLDFQNGGFTVFGEVIGSGMDVIDDIEAVPRFNAGAPFDNLPLENYPGGTILAEHLIVVNDISRIDKLTYTVVANTNPGLVTPSINGGELTLTYTAATTGSAQITVRATDLDGTFVDDTFEVTAHAANTDPTAVNDNPTTPENTPVTIDVLSNDTDAEDNVITIASVDRTGTNGAVTIVGDQISYQPPFGFNGNDSFDYTIDDGQGGSDTATVTVNVTTTAPVITAIPDHRAESGDTTVNLLANFSDPDLSDESHTVTIDWGDGGGDDLVEAGTVTEVVTPGPLTATVDYSFDTGTPFFDTQAKKDLFESIVDDVISALADDLDPIAPSGSDTWTATFTNPNTGAPENVVDLNVAANEIIIYAGGRDLGATTKGVGGPGGFTSSGTGAFIATVEGRGEAGALDDGNETDIGLWGGAISFSTNAGTTWHFDESTDDLDPGETDFYSVAYHEVLHLLGFGTSAAWNNLVDGVNDVFLGTASIAEYDVAGASPPLEPGDDGHWANGTTDGGDEVGLDPSLTSGTRKELTLLDYAALKDIGWEFVAETNGFTGTVSGNHTYDLDGTYTVTVTVTDPDDAVQTVEQFQVVIASIVTPADAGFALVDPGDWTGTGSPQFFFNSPGDGSELARWTFDVTNNPGVYRVSTSFDHFANRATNSPFTVFNGTQRAGLVELNQQNAADDFTDNGESWETLGDFYITADSLIIELSDKASGGIVVADSIRIEKVDELFEVISAVNPVADGFTIESGVWTFSAGNQIWLNGIGDGSEIAQWQFTDLEPGVYKVSVSYVASPGRATNAPYTVIDNTKALATVRIDQTVSANDFSEDGVNYEDLGTFQIDSTTMNVQLSDKGNGFVIAGKVRIERLDELFQIVEATDSDFSIESGDWALTAANVYSNGAGTGDEIVRWQFMDLDPGRYRISVTYTEFANRATDAPYTIFDGTTAVEIVDINQQLPADTFTENGIAFEDLGEFRITETSLRVELSDLANNFVIAGAVRIQRVDDLGDIVGIFDPGFTIMAPTGEWSLSALGTIYFNGPGSGTEAVQWEFTGLEKGIYRVSVTYEHFANRATDAPFTVFNDTTDLGTFDINQELAPNDFAEKGTNWEDLGNFRITTDTIRVILTDNANEFVIAQSVRVERIDDLVDVIIPTDPTSGGFSIESGVWNFSAGNDIYSNAAGSGNDIARWEFTNLTPGTYRVSVSYIHSPGRASDAPYTVSNGVTPLQTVEINQLVSANDLFEDGLNFEHLGSMFQITGTTLRVELTDDADGLVIAGAVRVEHISDV